jgi:hypothetical protein
VHRYPIATVLVVSILAAGSMRAATYAVPDDGTFVRNTTAIVIASAQTSRVQKNDGGGIETITTFSVRDVLKGSVPDSIEVFGRGGTLDNQALIIPGVPRFTDGEEVLLFLGRSSGVWRVRDLALGRFSFRTDMSGRRVLVRDEGEIVGFESRGGRHRELRRSADEFIKFVRAAASGGPARADYIVPTEPLLDEEFPDSPRRGLLPISQSHFSPDTYTYFAGAHGGRWTTFPGAVGFFTIGSITGAPSNGVGSLNAAFAAWNNDPNSNVNLLHNGPDNGTHNSGVDAPDGANTVKFESNLKTRFDVDPIACSPGGYSGVLGVGGFTLTGADHTGPDGDLFVTGIEADVEMNQGFSNCTFAINNGDLNSAIAHEVGHAIGFRHSDQDRNLAGTCTALIGECSSSAIMKSFIPSGLNATLQPWDQNAVSHVYPAAATPPPAAPTNVTATNVGSSQVLVMWTASSGATSYEVYRRAPGGAFMMIGAPTAMTSFTDSPVSPNTSYLYRVRAINAGGSSPDSGFDIATTVVFTNDPLTVGTTIQAIHLSQLRTAVAAVRALAAISVATFTDAATPGVTVKAIHINELRTRLNEALTALGIATTAYTDTVTATSTIIKAIHFQEIRNRVK